MPKQSPARQSLKKASKQACTNISRRSFVTKTALPRWGEGSAVAFLAPDDFFCTTGQVLHPNGGEIVNGQLDCKG
jgi:hypothetical protein